MPIYTITIDPEFFELTCKFCKEKRINFDYYDETAFGAVLRFGREKDRERALKVYHKLQKGK